MRTNRTTKFLDISASRLKAGLRVRMLEFFLSLLKPNPEPPQKIKNCLGCGVTMPEDGPAYCPGCQRKPELQKEISEHTVNEQIIIGKIVGALSSP